MQLRTEVENNSAREAEDGCSAARDAGEQFSSGSGVLEMITLLREMLKRKTPLQGMLKMSSKYSDAETSADGAQSSYSVRACIKLTGNQTVLFTIQKYWKFGRRSDHRFTGEATATYKDSSAQDGSSRRSNLSHQVSLGNGYSSPNSSSTLPKRT